MQVYLALVVDNIEADNSTAQVYKSRPTEAQVMRDYVLESGLDEADIENYSQYKTVYIWQEEVKE